MRKIIATGLAFLLLLLLAGVAMARPEKEEARGTIRGGVYEDINGDGRCLNTGLESKIAVPGVEVSLSANGMTLNLYSGSDGTYGLIPAGQGTWQVEVRPVPGLWRVTSANPLLVPVTTEDGLVQAGVNFCVQRLSWSTAAGPVPTDVVRPLTGAERAAISEALITNPPAPRPPENITETLKIPVDVDATPLPVWLSYLNLFREMGGLPPLAASEPLTYGSQWHSRYMVVNDTPIAHREDPANALYDPAGDQAAINGNLFATTQMEADHTWAINFFVSAPFHLVPVIDPRLATVGFGRYNEAVGTFNMTAVLDVRSAIAAGGDAAHYPYFFPGDGTETWVVRHSLYEWPDPMIGCPGYSRPSGPPLVLQLGDGSLTPRVTGHAVTMDGQPVESCLFDETSYANPDPSAQRTGRTILGGRDAIVIIPRQPLLGGRTYTVQVDVDGQSYSWQFSTGSPPA